MNVSIVVLSKHFA